MARDEYDWIDDAFDDAKPDPLAKGGEIERNTEYDWIDDAFDETKQDPLARKGMTGCSSRALLVGVLVLMVAIVWVVFVVAPLATIGLAN